MANLASMASSPLFDLPAEIRLKIYGFVFAGIKIVASPPPLLKGRRRVLHRRFQVLLTCRQFYHEAVGVVSSSATWLFSHVDLPSFVENPICQVYLPSIKHLWVRYNGKEPLKQTILSLPALQTALISLSFEVEINQHGKAIKDLKDKISYNAVHELIYSYSPFSGHLQELVEMERHFTISVRVFLCSNDSAGYVDQEVSHELRQLL